MLFAQEARNISIENTKIYHKKIEEILDNEFNIFLHEYDRKIKDIELKIISEAKQRFFYLSIYLDIKDSRLYSNFKRYFENLGYNVIDLINNQESLKFKISWDDKEINI